MSESEIIRHIDMIIRHFKAVNKASKKASKEFEKTSFGNFHAGKADCAEEAVSWLEILKDKHEDN